MKNRLTLICFTVSCLTCFALLRLAAGHFFVPLDQETANEPQIQVSKTVLNVRYDPKQADARPKLPIRNMGSKRLIVRTREANCDCFLREASVIIAPGESKYLPLRFPMHALAYCSQFDLVLVSNDPQQPNLPIKVMVEDSISVIPESAVSVLQ